MRAPSLVLRFAVLSTALLASGCVFSAKARQARHAAQVQRMQADEAVDRDTESKADRASRLNQVQQEARLRQLQSELAARGDPDSLAASAVFAGELSGSAGGASLELAARAVAGAPGRADLAFLQLQLCESTPECDAAPLETRQQRLDPENGIGWSYSLVRADRANDGVAWRRARDGLAHSKRVELYLHQIVSRLAGAAAGKAGFDFSAVALELLSIESAFTPAFEPVSRACSVRDIQQPEVLGQCRQIAAAFRNADTGLLEAYGSTLALRLWPADSVEGQAIATERRGLRYRVELSTRYAAKVNSPQARKTLAMLITRYPTEQTAYRALFVGLGVSPDPPANWTDQSPGG
jgi:hypothetical protein